MADDEKKTVTVLCSVRNGLALQLCVPHDDGTGVPAGRTMVRSGEVVTIGGPRSATEGPGSTVVDRAFWEAWLEQNKDNPVVARGLVRLERKDGGA